MIYTVHGTCQQVISVEVEADSEAEALEKACADTWGLRPDVWDADYDFYMATVAN